MTLFSEWFGEVSFKKRENGKRTMKHILISFLVGSSLLGAGASSLLAQTNNTLKIYSAIEIEYPTEIGKSYELQGAVDFNNWTPIGNPVLGHGRPVTQIYSTRSGDAVPFAAYRLHIKDGPTNGFAPWSLSGARVLMDDRFSTNSVEYLTNDHGQDNYSGALDKFSYQFSRLTDNSARVDRTFTPDRRESIRYAYTGPGVGTWVREEYRQGTLERRILGVFRYLADTTNSVPGVTNLPVTVTTAQPPAPPTVVTGLVYYVHSGSRPDELQFKTGTTGIEMPTPAVGGDENEVEVSPGGNTFTYAYKVLSSNTASLIINFGYYGFGGDKNEYDLSYTDGPSGSFVRRIYRLGALYSTDTGVFSPFVQPPPSPTSTSNPAAMNPPPATPVGLTYTVQDDTLPPRLVFRTTNSGIEFDDSAPSDFIYSYLATGPNTVHMVVQFKADRWDEYDLTFTNGIHGISVRRQFKKGQLDRTTSGTFDVALSGL